MRRNWLWLAVDRGHCTGGWSIGSSDMRTAVCSLAVICLSVTAAALMNRQSDRLEIRSGSNRHPVRCPDLACTGSSGDQRLSRLGIEGRPGLHGCSLPLTNASRASESVMGAVRLFRVYSDGAAEGWSRASGSHWGWWRMGWEKDEGREV